MKTQFDEDINANRRLGVKIWCLVVPVALFSLMGTACNATPTATSLPTPTPTQTPTPTPTAIPTPVPTAKSINATGLDLNQVIITSAKSADRRIIAQGYSRPSIAQLPDGELLVVMFRLTPGSNDEDVYISRSKDGVAWSTPGNVLPGRDAYLFVLSDGTILLSHVTLLRDSRFPGRGFISRSVDEGWGWTLIELPSTLFDEPPVRITTIRSFLELSDGTIVAFVGALFKDGFKVYRIQSFDRGHTWKPGTMLFRNADETSLVRLPAGKLLAVVRMDGPALGGVGGSSKEWQEWVNTGHYQDFMTIAESVDDGRTWTTPTQVLPASLVPAQLLLLKDGRLLMTYGVRSWPRGVQAIISDDEGKTWDFSKRYMLAWHGWDDNTGYPWSIQLPDKSIITVYYTRRPSAETALQAFSWSDVFAELVHWKLD